MTIKEELIILGVVALIMFNLYTILQIGKGLAGLVDHYKRKVSTNKILSLYNKEDGRFITRYVGNYIICYDEESLLKIIYGEDKVDYYQDENRLICVEEYDKGVS